MKTQANLIVAVVLSSVVSITNANWGGYQQEEDILHG